MKPRKLKPRPKPAPPSPNPASRKIRFALGPFHDFWLFREGERAYNDYRDLLGREDAPVRLPMDVAENLPEALKAVPTINIAWKNNPPFGGLNQFGPTVINYEGAAAFGAVCETAIREWAQSPDPLIITSRFLQMAGRTKPPKPYYFKADRDKLVQDLETLADWSKQAATGAFFILHIGV